MFKKITFTILALFFAYGVFTSTDTIQSDRDNAVIISAKALMNFENPYSYKTEIGQEITTGLFNAFISIPFVYLFGNVQLLSFLFYFLFLILIYKNRYLIYLTFLATPLLYRIMYYRLDELYWVIVYVTALITLKSKLRYLLVIPVLLSRNIFNFDFHVLLYNIDYWLLIVLTSNALLFLILRNFRLKI